ncbi:3-hydroxyacyl-ACP dehydratase FabZ [Rossellomorea sp. LjRoot5]|uniref:3-hydroxyacyl-ACP dehydratase FabZ n=1 Tax=Rossellomorea sp. LjRoot5 TaxID=3342331 RepID=UPI003ED0885B
MGISLGIDEIIKLLPHKYPFLLLDKVIDLEPGNFAKGIKNVSINEEYFQGHFPKEKVVPGILLVESLAQLTAIVYSYDAQQINNNQSSEKVGYLAAIKNVKFIKKVIPGDQLILEARIKKKIGMLSEVEIKAFVNNVIVLKGEIIVSEKEEGKDND